MVDKSEVPEHEESAADLRNKLIKRLAVAGVLVAILLGVLAFFDYLSTPPEEAETPEFTEPVPVAPKKSLSQPVTPASELSEPPTPVPIVVEPPPPPVVQPTVVPTISSEPTQQVVVPRQDSRSAIPAPAVLKPVAPPAAPVEPKISRPVPELTAAPTVNAPTSNVVPENIPVQPAKPAARVVESRPAPVVVPSGVSRLFSGFLLQAGVFTSQQRAEELHAKLTLSGVPSTLETRVQVGPFKTRQEAEAAQIKLKELGVDSVLVPPRSAKH